jgi:hypothetical protein|tara:strand:+ start:754 stop:1134 length:381 start_codon:yes stop_codon:yes gene_type:complete
MLDNVLFRELQAHEVHDFKSHAHEHWVMDMKPESIWHPVVRQEWEHMQELATTINEIYKKIQPDIDFPNIDPISPEAWGETVRILTTVLKGQWQWDNVNTEHFALWEELPTEAQQIMISQVTRRYF